MLGCEGCGGGLVQGLVVGKMIDKLWQAICCLPCAEINCRLMRIPMVLQANEDTHGAAG
jgi:hypothetical protein